MPQYCVHLQERFLRESGLPYEAAAPDDVAPFREQLAQMCVHNGVRRPGEGDGIEGLDFYRVPFEQARVVQSFLSV
jgi:hypothetical protein